MQTRICSALAVLLLVLAPATLFAQTSNPENLWDKAKIHLGGLALDPTIALTNAGVDNNVYNAADGNNPQSDFSVTVTPATNAYLRVGRTWLSARVNEDLVWFFKFDQERSANATYSGSWYVPLNRIILQVNGHYLSSRARPGFEIDARSQHTELGYDGAAEFRVLSKTFIGLTGGRSFPKFDSTSTFLNVSLQEQLQRTDTNYGVTVRQQLTPLTEVTLSASKGLLRFDFTPERNSDSTNIAATFKFDPFALLKGNASFGYTDYKPVSPLVPGYSGTTANVNLSYVAFGVTKLSVAGNRNVQFSFDINQPYYVLTGATGTISQEIGLGFDVTGSAGINQLAYRTQAGARVVDDNRTDYVKTLSLGAGYRVAPGLRAGFTVTKTNRTSVLADRQYNDLATGLSITYVFVY